MTGTLSTAAATAPKAPVSTRKNVRRPGEPFAWAASQGEGDWSMAISLGSWLRALIYG
jgi:hypothetical protein